MLIQHQQQASNNQSGGDESLPERIDNTIGMKLEVEFNDIYNIVRNPLSLKEHNFASRFALVTPDGQLILYSDVHMTMEISRLSLA